MTNKCDFVMKAKGSAGSLGELYKIMNLSHPKKFGFFNLSNISTDGTHEKCDNGDIIVSIFGECSESVYACMLKGNGSLFNLYIREGIFTKDFAGTHLIRESKRLNLEIEIHSVKEGDDFRDGFHEHYFLNNGELIINDFNYFEYNENEQIDTKKFLTSKSFTSIS